jgi:hypothetical protein
MTVGCLREIRPRIATDSSRSQTSTMSLLGLVRHMADVERNRFRRVMARADAPPLYWSDDAEDADWAGGG